jgi:ribonuclease HII
VAAVCFDVERLDRRRLARLDDSKRCAPELREELLPTILELALQVVVIAVPAAEIDRYGLHRSNLRALGRALEAIDPAPDVCLTDGFSVPGCGREHSRVIGGDGRSAAIAAASVVAKVVRDRHMHRMAERYPQYGFERHVGYITPEHGAAVRKHGVTPLHRRSWQARAYADLELATT